MIINERSGVIVMGGDVRLQPGIITHGNLTVTIAENTAKPLTPAQMADPLLAKQIASVAESEEKVQNLQSENDELKARIAALEASRGESQGSESPNEQFPEPAEIAEPEEIPDPAKPKGKGGNKTKAG